MSDLSNPLLQDAENKIEAGLTPANRADYLKVVVAGMHAALDKGPDGILASLKLSKDPVRDAAKGAVTLALIMRKQSKGVMPLKAMVPGGLTLMLKALDFADRSKLARIGQAELVRASHVFTDSLFAAFKITGPMIAQLTRRVHQVTQNPAMMHKIQLKAGTATAGGAPPLPGLPGGPPVTPGLINRAAA